MSSGTIRNLLVVLLLAGVNISLVYGQEVQNFENEIPFNLRMAFFRGPADSTRCLITVAVENQNLLFFRRTAHFEGSYEAFLSMRENESHNMLRGLWRKDLQVPSYDETTLEKHFDPLQTEMNVKPGKYEGFAEVKDLNAHTYGNGRVSVNVPDLTENLPKLSTPFFYEAVENADSLANPQMEVSAIKSASLQYASGQPIFLMIEVYADSSNPPRGWKLTAEVVKALMVFPRVEAPLTDGLLTQRKLIRLPSQTLGLGSYEVDIYLRDEKNQSLARATSFTFRIVKSESWISDNYLQEIRYLRYLASEKEIKALMGVPEEQRQAALDGFWQKIDPVPATAINELKVQYFERIDYANSHFSTDQREGWETNMGEVYILLGPPTEIYGSRMNQIWVYEVENLVLYFFNQNLRNRSVFDHYVRERRWWSN